MAKSRYYAYFLVKSEDSGITDSWESCQGRTAGHSARYKGFGSVEDARKWLNSGALYEDRKAGKAVAKAELPVDAVYFDAGTGRGRGVEVNVTDRAGVPMAHMVAPAENITEFGTVLLSKGRTNNYGELMGCFLAIRIAEKLGRDLILGDSNLVLDYWSKGRVNVDTASRDPDLTVLVKKTAAARRRFEASGGRFKHVPGGLNPADLGFHRD